LALWVRKASWVRPELLVRLARPGEPGTPVRLVQREKEEHVEALVRLVYVDHLVLPG